MVARVLKTRSNFDRDAAYYPIARHNSARFVGSKKCEIDAETLCSEIVSGKASIYRAKVDEIKHGAFLANDVVAIDNLIAIGLIVYVINNANYRKVKKLYEELYT